MSASNRFELHQSGTENATGQSGKATIPTFSQLLVGVDITAASGAPRQIDLWLQVSDDGGTTWYDQPYDQQMITSAAAADVTADLNKRNIVNAHTTTAIQTVAVYKAIPSDTIRLAWVISGTVPVWTFSSSAVGK